jgi:CRP-like cAMP-binding protein
MIHDLKPLLAAHPFFAGLSESFLDLAVGCAKNVRFNAESYLFKEGDDASDFYLVRAGRVAIEMDIGVRPVVVNTVGPGEILGWSWLVPPHRWHFDARAVELTRAIALDGVCLRGKCNENHSLGFELLKRFASDMEQRLYRAWTQVVDIYGPPE